jgi:hypothetical protein
MPLGTKWNLIRPFFVNEVIEGGSRREEFVSLLSKCKEIFDAMNSNESFVDIIDENRRYVFGHRFKTGWLIDVWRGNVDPQDQEALAILNASIDEDIAKFKAGGEELSRKIYAEHLKSDER